jgi:6,7-dimethyl-8-ribityllumazine synthase
MMEGKLDASGLQIGVVVAVFNEVVTEGLLAGALDLIERAGGEAPIVARVPGAFELPVVAKALIERGCHCVVALGAVIEGETDHYEHVATQAAAGLRQVAAATGVPIGFGVLTTREAGQARERSLAGPANKGAEAAEAAIRTADLLRSI